MPSSPRSRELFARRAGGREAFMYPSRRRVVAMCLGLPLIGASISAQSQPDRLQGQAPGSDVVVPGRVALSSLVTLSDHYLKAFADDLSMLALTDAARSAGWELIRPYLAAVADRNVDALVWFALPDGSYWSVQQGQSSGNLSDRPYFAVVLAGETVMGALVASKATARSSAIVAVPVRNDAGAVIGVLGASIYLDLLSERLNTEMSMGEDTIFYSFDATPLLALEWDPQLILVDPFSLGPDIRAVFEYMLTHDEGTVRYRWARRWRTVIFRRSQVTGWWYVFGVVGGRSAAVGPR